VDYLDNEITEMERYFNECCSSSCKISIKADAFDIPLAVFGTIVAVYSIYRLGKLPNTLDKVAIGSTAGLTLLVSNAKLLWAGEKVPCTESDKIQREQELITLRRKIKNKNTVSDIELIALCKDIIGVSEDEKRDTIRRIVKDIPDAKPENPRVIASSIGLADLNSSCTSSSMSRTTECTIAIAKYCQKQGFIGGFSQNVDGGSGNVICLNGIIGSISFSGLSAIHRGCTDSTKAQHADCASAAHRYCNKEHNKSSGVIQDISGMFADVLCFNGDIRKATIDDLKTRNIGCNSLAMSQSQPCVEAIQKYCNSIGNYNGGISQEVPLDALVFSCTQGTLRRVQFAPQL